jgi:hypothetical protein
MTQAIPQGARGPAAPEVEHHDQLTDLIKLADERYRCRGDRARASSLSTGESGSDRAGQWRPEVERLVDGSYELEWRLSRALFLDGEKNSELYALGAMHGRRAADLDRKRVEGHFWMGVNLALHAEARKGLRGALDLLKARWALGRACEISEDYHGAGPLRVLGRLDHKSPRILGGNLERSLIHYERALAIAPTNTVTLVYAAQLQIDRRDLKRAAFLLETVMGLPIDPDWEFENIRDKNLAKSMLERLQR